jgi:fumarate reductase subunit D
MAKQQGFSKDDIIDGKMYAVMAYLSILCIIPLILKKNNPFVLAHGKQGLVLFVAEAGTMILSIVFSWVFNPLMLLLMVLSFWGMVSAIRGIMVELPVVSDIADKIVL